MEKKILYLDRTYDDYLESLIDFSKSYYPNLATSYNDASVGSWLLELNAAIADELSYHIDRVFQETNINSANNISSIYSMARNVGFKVPGPKGAMAEVTFSCNLPLEGNEPSWKYAPIVKMGTKVSSGSQVFELIGDVDFSKQFNSDGFSDRTISPLKNTNGALIGYKINKKALVVAGEMRIYKKSITNSDITPFMEILLPIENVMGVSSIVVKQGTVFQSNPTMGEFFMAGETSDKYTKTKRFFEVDYLSQQKVWGDVTGNCTYEYSYPVSGATTGQTKYIPVYSVTKGEWKPIRQKFITEYTDKGYLKIVFGSGTQNTEIPDTSEFAKYQISRMVNNDALGVLPDPNTTIFILYRVGGGATSNVAKGSINNISYLNIEYPTATETIPSSDYNTITNTLKVTNETPSVSGKDMPSVEELRNMIKYYVGSQERCVTAKDYVSRVLMMPSRYGTPFRVSAAEENNKIMLYILGVDHKGNLDAILPRIMVHNIEEYLSNYRMINDFVEIKSGKILNLSFEADVFIDKEYNKTDVVTNIISTIYDYMNINKHHMGDDIFVGDIEKEVSKIDGVLNLIELRVYNETGDGYSSSQTTQEIVSEDECITNMTVYNPNRLQIDLKASDGMLISEGDAMFEIKDKTVDIRVRVKER